MVRPPRRIQDVQTAVNAVEGWLAAGLHRWRTVQELADAIGVRVEDIADAQKAQGCFHPTSLDAPMASASTLSLATTLTETADTYGLVDAIESLRPAVAELPDREQFILQRRFVDHRTQAEIGKELGISQMQVSRLLHDVMQVLRTALTVYPHQIPERSAEVTGSFRAPRRGTWMSCIGSGNGPPDFHRPGGIPDELRPSLTNREPPCRVGH